MDRDAFAELVRQHQPGVSRFVARYLRSREDNDEVVQETFLRAWQQIARFQPDTNFAAWVLTIARFLCMARLKDVQRHPPPARSPSRRDRARRAHPLGTLPLAQREVIALRFFDELDYRSIAQITGDTE